MWTFDIISLWVAAIFLGWLIMGADITLLNSLFTQANSFFESVNTNLDINVLENSGKGIMSLLSSAHESFSSAIKGFLSRAT